MHINEAVKRTVMTHSDMVHALASDAVLRSQG